MRTTYSGTSQLPNSGTIDRWRSSASATLKGCGRILCTLTIVCCGRAGDATGNVKPHFDRAMGAVLTGEASQQVVTDQCGANRSSLIRSTWVPSDSEIAVLEERFAPSLQRALDRQVSDRRARLNASEFYRQYIGVVHPDGRRMIFVNGFHREFTRLSASFGTKEPSDTLLWRTHPVFVCDGGLLFFRVEFDPKTKKLGRIRFNQRTG